eukprot:gene11921-13007_t
MFTRNTRQILSQRLKLSNVQSFARQSTQKPANKSIVLKDTNVSIQSPWQEVKDPKGSQLVYYWNASTNQTTALGAPKPQHWVEVQDPNGTSLTYWWNPETNQTTALGEANPSDLAQLQQYQQQHRPFGPSQGTTTLGSAMKSYFLWGVGMTFAFTLVR